MLLNQWNFFHCYLLACSSPSAFSFGRTNRSFSYFGQAVHVPFKALLLLGPDNCSLLMAVFKINTRRLLQKNSVQKVLDYLAARQNIYFASWTVMEQQNEKESGGDLRDSMWWYVDAKVMGMSGGSVFFAVLLKDLLSFFIGLVRNKNIFPYHCKWMGAKNFTVATEMWAGKVTSRTISDWIISMLWNTSAFY